MAEAFDPYRKWLGIPPEEQPPHHYRLLGIPLFESDSEVIAHAADQRMAHVKTFAAGRHAALSQTILNELSAARVCLLNPQAKAVYDEHLRARFRSQPAPLAAVPLMASEALPSADGSTLADAIPTAAAGVAGSGGAALLRAAPAPLAGESPDDAVDGAVSGTVVARRSVWPRRRRASPVSSVVVVVVLAVLVGVAIAISTSSRQEEPPMAPSVPTSLAATRTPGSSRPSGAPRSTMGTRPAAAEPSAADTQSNAAAAASERATTEPSVAGPAGSYPAVTAPGEAESTTARATDDSTTATEPSTPSAGVAAPSRPSLGPPSPAEPTEPQPEGPSFEQLGPASKPAAAVSAQALASAQGLAEPSESEKKRAEGIILQTFTALASVTEGAAKVSLADELIKLARETRDDPASQFMAFRMAGDLLAEAGQMQRAVERIDELAQRFAVDAAALKLDVLRKGAEFAFGRSGTEATWSEALDTAQRVADDALAADQFDAAQQAFRIAETAAGKLGDRRAQTELKAQSADLARLKSHLPELLVAEQTLENQPDDTAANLEAGLWDCLVRGRWDRGLARLAKGSDTTLADLARQELAKPLEPEVQAAVSDGWWAQAEPRKGLEAQRARRHAVEGYQAALDGLAGLTRKHVEKRLEEAGIKTTDYALKFDGKGGYVVVRGFAYDGSTPITVEAICRPTGAARGGEDPGGRNWWERLFNVQHVVSNLGRGGFALGRLGDGWALAFSQRATRGLPLSLARSERGAGQLRWVHIAGVYDGQMVRVFVEGQLRDSARCSGPHVPSALPVLVGAQPPESGAGAPQGFFEGMIRGVHISRTVRYTQDFEPPKKFKRDGATTVLLWFDRGEGDRIMDSSGRTVVAELKGAQWVALKPEDLIDAPAEAERPRGPNGGPPWGAPPGGRGGRFGQGQGGAPDGR